MNRTKLIVYVTVLSLAAVSLVIDRFVIGLPRAADAQSAVEGLLIDPTSSAGTVIPAEYDMPEPFPPDMPRWDWSAALNNPFEPPPVIARRRDQRLAPDQPAAPGNVPLRRPGQIPTVADFLAAHSLKGVFVGQSAIVDGEVVLIGRKLDGAKLLKVERNEAHFQCADGEAVLTIE